VPEARSHGSVKKEIPVTLTIAGSDSGGGAGIQADLKTFHAFGCFGTSVITALTAQNTQTVSQIAGTDPTMVRAQLEAVLSDFPVRSIKTGMLFSEPIIRIIEPLLADCKKRGIPIVMDPVMIAATGAPLMEDGAMQAMAELAHHAFLITPNLPETEALTGLTQQSVLDMKKAAHQLRETTGAAVLIKGGHLSESESKDWIIDILLHEGGEEEIRGRRVSGLNTHGTGCTLSAAIAARLAHGEPLSEAVRSARKYLELAMQEAPGFGHGTARPLNHLIDPGRNSSPGTT